MYKSIIQGQAAYERWFYALSTIDDQEANQELVDYLMRQWVRAVPTRSWVVNSSPPSSPARGSYTTLSAGLKPVLPQEG